MTSYKWTIEKVTVSTDNAVTRVYWRCDGTQDKLTASCAGVRELFRSDTFIPYEQLSEQQVLDWCFAPEVVTLKDGTTITKHLKDESEAQVAEQIARQLAQKQSEPALPWAQIPA